SRGLHGEAHLARLKFDAELAEQLQEVRVRAIVAYDEPGIDGDAPAFVFDVVRMRVTAHVIARLEDGDLVLAVQVIGGDVSRNAAADDGNFHEHSPPGRAELSGQCCGT